MRKSSGPEPEHRGRPRKLREVDTNSTVMTRFDRPEAIQVDVDLRRKREKRGKRKANMVVLGAFRTTRLVVSIASRSTRELTAQISAAPICRTRPHAQDPWFSYRPLT